MTIKFLIEKYVFELLPLEEQNIISFWKKNGNYKIVQYHLAVGTSKYFSTIRKYRNLVDFLVNFCLDFNINLSQLQQNIFERKEDKS